MKTGSGSIHDPSTATHDPLISMLGGCVFFIICWSTQTHELIFRHPNTYLKCHHALPFRPIWGALRASQRLSWRSHSVTKRCMAICAMPAICSSFCFWRQRPRRHFFQKTPPTLSKASAGTRDLFWSPVPRNLISRPMSF